MITQAGLTQWLYVPLFMAITASTLRVCWDRPWLKHQWKITTRAALVTVLLVVVMVWIGGS